MFTALSERLTATLKRLTGRGVLSEQDVTEALREIRRHLLEADVSFEVTTGFVERVRERAVGVIAVKSVSPGQQVAKLVHDELARMLGASDEDLARKVGARHAAPLQFAPVGPTVILLVGLQGSGKTTTAAKLARRLKLEQKAPGLVAADPYRPAAGEQLRQLGEQVGVPVFGMGDEGRGTGVVEFVQRAVRAAEKARCRTVIVDTAGRLQIDAALMGELKDMRAAVSPREVLLVADGVTGQDAVRIARGFQEGVGLTGVILTKLDGDARGGAALSIHGVTGVPIKFIGTGEHVVGAQHAAPLLEPFDPVRMAGRILGQGDVVALVEQAAATVDAEAAQRLGQKARSKARDGPGGFPGRAEADAGDGAAQAGAGPLARGERQGAGRRTGRRQAPEARGGDRAVDDAGGAGRPVDPQRLAPAADRQGGGSLGAGREPAAGAVPADAEALEKDLGNGNSHSAAA